MIKFLLKGLMRDRSRSLFPVLTVFIGVFLAVFFYSFMNGVLEDMVRSTAHYQTGHLRIMTQAYAKEANQNPNDLAFIGVAKLLDVLNEKYPELIWTPRIKFGGLLDIPDEEGETKTQGPVSGMALDLFSSSSVEVRLLKVKEAIMRGRMPKEAGEILIADEFAKKLQVSPGDTATLISSTMYGSMAMTNYKIAGTVQFGVSAMDRGTIFADISDIQVALDMPDTAGEILGFFPDDIYHEKQAPMVAAAFNQEFKDSDNPFSPQMGTLPEESGLTDYLGLIDSMSIIIIVIFVLAMSIVLWNAGLMGSLRRYGEIGVRMAIGEARGHIYKTLILESVSIGIFGSVLGTLAGVAVSYLMQMYGLNFGFLFKNSALMISSVYRAQVTVGSFVIGFAPGIISTVLGTAIAGIGIYKRQTSQLFKELEV
ncbi:MAG: FtsX-like permease family protein [Candidatus Aminicenantes bacterium]|nr:FtsX-like permease family protein [Candidatus Aminicenantes bacterium]